MILLTILEPILKKIRTGVVDKCLNIKVVAIFNILITICLLTVICIYYNPINYSMVRGWFTWILTIIGIVIFAVVTTICIFCLLLLYLIVLRPYIILFYDLMIYIFSFNFRDSDIQNPIEKFKTKNNKKEDFKTKNNQKNDNMTPQKKIFTDILIIIQDLVTSGDDFNSIPNKLFIMALNTAKTNTPYLKKIPSIPLKDLVLLLIIILISSLLYVIGTLLLLGINQTLNFGESIVKLLTFSSLLFSIFIVIELFYFLLFRFSIKCLVLAAFDLLMTNTEIQDLIINLIGLVFKLAPKNC